MVTCTEEQCPLEACLRGLSDHELVSMCGHANEELIRRGFVTREAMDALQESHMGKEANAMVELKLKGQADA